MGCFLSGNFVILRTDLNNFAWLLCPMFEEQSGTVSRSIAVNTSQYKHPNNFSHRCKFCILWELTMFKQFKAVHLSKIKPNAAFLTPIPQLSNVVSSKKQTRISSCGAKCIFTHSIWYWLRKIELFLLYLIQTSITNFEEEKDIRFHCCNRNS